MFTPVYKAQPMHAATLSDIGVEQYDGFNNFGHNLRATLRDAGIADHKVKVRLVNNHHSRGHWLPVAAINTAVASYIVRDNFYGHNLVVESCSPVHLSMSDVHGEPMTYEWYLKVIEDKRSYCYGCWSDEEMAHPGILRVKRPNGTWSEVSGQEKDRWIARDYYTSWYERDWSSGKLFPYYSPENGCWVSWPAGQKFSSNTSFFLAQKCFLEGIDALYAQSNDAVSEQALSPYIPGKTAFCAYLRTFKEVANLIVKVEQHLRPNINLLSVVAKNPELLET